MTQFLALNTEGNPTRAVAKFLSSLITQGIVEGVLVPARQPHGKVVMQSLISDPAQLDCADPFAPVVWRNSAATLSSLTAKPHGVKLAAVLRSCEARAFVELVKLNQGSTEDLLLIGSDCWGRYENEDYQRLAEKDEDLSRTFLNRMAAEGKRTEKDADLANACKACEFPVVSNADLQLCLIGFDPAREIGIEALTDKGVAALKALDVPLKEVMPAGRAAAVDSLRQMRVAFRDSWFKDFKEKTGTMEALQAATAACINCYNCRVACPVCYCRECVFVTDTFRHDSERYWQWAKKRGMLKMPTDTIFYHLTRMLHMSTLCVGCGQCSSACPNDIPVVELFRTVAEATQARFDYVPGRDFQEKQPLATFRDGEFEDVSK